MKPVYTEYQLFQKNEFIQKLVDQAAKYFEGCVQRDVMPTLQEFGIHNSDHDMNLLSKKDFDKTTVMEEDVHCPFL